jgi:hypothetical protein
VAQIVALVHRLTESAPLARVTLTFLQTKLVLHLARLVSTVHQTTHARTVAQIVKLAHHRPESALHARLTKTSSQTKLVLHLARPLSTALQTTHAKIVPQTAKPVMVMRLEPAPNVRLTLHLTPIKHA